MKYRIHKRIIDKTGGLHTLCTSNNNSDITAYHWGRVTCEKCKELGFEIKFSAKQLREIARTRREQKDKRAERCN